MKIKKKNKNIYLEESSEENYDENSPLLLTYIDNKDEYYKSEGYGKLIKVDELKSQAEKINTSTAKWMVESYTNIRTEWRKKESWGDRFLKKYLSIVTVGVAVPMIVSVMASLPVMKDVLNVGIRNIEIWNAGVAIVLITGALAWFINYCKNEKRYERMQEIIKDLSMFCRDWYTVKDKNGDPVKAIWFLYHNLNFKNNDERIKFLFENYSRYNYPLEMGVEKYQRYNKNVKEYLSVLVKAKNNEYLSSEDNVQEIGDSLVSV